MSVPVILFFACAVLAVSGAVLLILPARADPQRACADRGDGLAGGAVSAAGCGVHRGGQIIVYAGAIMVLFVFVIMLLNAGAEERTNLSQMAHYAGSAAGRIFGAGAGVVDRTLDVGQAESTASAVRARHPRRDRTFDAAV